MPSLIFVGPDQWNTVYVQDASGNRHPIITVLYSKNTKPSLSIARIYPNGQQQHFASASFSSLSGTITLSLHGQEIKVRPSYEGMQASKDFESHVGKLKWKPAGWGYTEELWDSKSTKLARYTLNTMSPSKDPKLEIYVRCDDLLTDMIIATGLALHREAQKELKNIGTAMEVVGEIASA